MKVLLRLILVLIAFQVSTLHAQDQAVFNNASSHYINGDAVLIGNNILGAHESKPLNDFSLLNDQIRMKYIDIDGKASTFSSSSASIKIKDTSARVVSATLYWAAVYPFAKGTKRERTDEIIYYGSGDRKTPITRVLLKTPGSKDYKEVDGTLLFDGFEQEGFEDSAPYFCYADITGLIKESEDLNGEYMVANVKATEGFVSGGGAAGWFIFLVYESESLPPKYISSFHGFASINDNAVDIGLTDFKTVEEGEIKASLYVAALEGDSKLYQDRMEILKATDSSFVFLSNKLRPVKNFFNGKITSGENYITDRYPNSTNALGFDLLKMKVPNEVFYNDQTETKIRFSTRADRYYAFFTAFSIEINDIFQLSKEAIDQEVLTETTSEEVSEINNQKSDIVDEQIPEKVEEVEKEEEPVLTETLSEEEKIRIEKRMRKREMNIPGMNKGYYLITNVFSKPSYARRWEAFVKSKGYEPYTFVNPRNNWLYISVYSGSDLSETYKNYNKLVKLEYFEEIWMFKINMD
ncbi:MAG: hypothetical protein HKM99_05085 [Flavobacteriaceae bacterium]|nr:hypothetical protein [Flavobacteriaceae bacterium]